MERKLRATLLSCAALALTLLASLGGGLAGWRDRQRLSVRHGLIRLRWL